MTNAAPGARESAGGSAVPDAPGKLRIGVLLQGQVMPAWQALALSRLAHAPYCELVLAVLPQRGSHTPAPRRRWTERLLDRTIARLDAKIECEHDAQSRVDASALLHRIPVVDASDFRKDSGSTAAAVPGRLDLLLDFADTADAPAYATLGKHGLWRFTHPYCGSGYGIEGAFWPVYCGWPIAETVLERVRSDGRCSPVARARPATHLLSLKLSASALGWRMASLLAHKVRELHELGGEALNRAPDACAAGVQPTERSRPPPRASHLLRYIGRNVTRRARASVARRLTHEQWFLMFGLGEEPRLDASRFTAIVPPRDRFWADPHVLERDGRFYVFVEELAFASDKGRIAVLTIERDGSWGEAIPVLERDYHLSYPFVFEHEGELYMIPESQAHRTIDLYRCVGFPARWQHVTTLLQDAAATDSTLIRRDGRWWMFTNLVDVAGASSSEELYIFSSDRLIGGEWKSHPRNPVISDARRSRPAGAIVERAGRLIRPSQDCSVRYGYGVRLNEIETLTEHEYRETEVGRIEPTWDSRITAVHTLAFVPGITVVDALRPRLAIRSDS